MSREDVPMLTEIDHVAIAVNDLEAAIAYYRDAFGAEVELVPSPDGITPGLIPSMMRRAAEIAEQTGAFATDQFNNTDMVEGYRRLGEELLDQLPGPPPISAFCSYVGTAGCFLGVSRALAAGLLDVLARRSTFDPTALRTHVEHRYGAAVVGRQIADLYDDVLRETRSSSSVVLSERASLAEQALPREAERQPDRGPMTPSALVLLVAFNRRNLDAVLARSPAWLIEDVTVVTSGGPVPGALRTVSLDAASTATLNRAALWKRPTGDHAISPLRWVWRLAIRTWWAMRVLPSFRAAVDRELARVVEEMRATVPSGDRRQDAVVPLVVCQSGFDLLAAGGAVRSGRARLAPGSLRWLGDVRWASMNGARRASQADPSSSA